MKYKNANIKTEKELYVRMINGEEFLFYEAHSFFIMKFVKKTSSFEISREIEAKNKLNLNININNIDFGTLEVKVDWKDEVSIENPVWCWVGDSEKQISLKRISPRAINKFSTKSDYCFNDQHGISWKFAEPIKKGDMKFWDDNDGE